MTSVKASISSSSSSGGTLATATKGTTVGGAPTSTDASVNRQPLDVILYDASGNPVTSFGTNTTIVSFVTDLVMLNPTTTAYTVGDAIGGSFTITGASLSSGGTGILQSIELISVMDSSAYRNQAVTATSANPCVFTLNGHQLLNGMEVRMGTTGTPPTNFSPGISYYVVSAATNTFQLSNTIGGTGVGSASTGTSVTITQFPAQLPAVLYLTNSTLGTVNDNSAFYPTSTQSLTKIALLSLNTDPLISDYRDNDANIRNLSLPYQTVGGTSLFGVFIYTGTNGAVLAALTQYRVRINMILY